MTTKKALEVLYEAAAMLHAQNPDAGFTQDVKKAVGVFNDLMFAADQFAAHDPAVDWPSDRYHNSVEAILAGWDDEREKRAHADEAITEAYRALALGHEEFLAEET